MRVRPLWIVASLAGIVLVGRALEIMPMQVVFVKPEVPTPVILAVGTPDELEKLRFVIIEPPKYGVLLGIPPELIYVPYPGFLGTDWFSFVVQHAETGGLIDYGTVQLRVLRPVAIVTPAFRFEGMFTLSGPTVSLDAYSFVFGVCGRFQYFDAQMLASWNQTGFTSFQGIGRVELEGMWPAPWRLPVTSTLTFNPATLSLTSWTVDVRATVLGWHLSYYFYFAGVDPQTNSYTLFNLSGSIGGISLTSRTRFATLTPTFEEHLLTLRGAELCPGCPTRWEAEYAHRKTGFERLSLLVRDVPIPCPACGSLQTFLDVKVTITPEEKRVEPTLRLISSFVACVRPLAGLVTPAVGLGILGVEVWGVEVRCDILRERELGSYKGRFATSFAPTRDSAVTGYPQFFEVLQVEGPVKPCCGSPGWWQISLYFSREDGRLFGLAMSDITLYFPISQEVLAHVRLKSGLIDPANPAKAWELTLGWKALF